MENVFHKMINASPAGLCEVKFSLQWHEVDTSAANTFQLFFWLKKGGRGILLIFGSQQTISERLYIHSSPIFLTEF